MAGVNVEKYDAIPVDRSRSRNSKRAKGTRYENAMVRRASR